MSTGGKNHRKNKPNNRSTARGKLNSQNSMTIMEGVYSNPRVVHTLLSVMGTKCNTQVKNGKVYIGVFHTASSNMDIALGAAHLQQQSDQNGNETQSILNANPSEVPKTNEVMDQLIFKAPDFVLTTFPDVDLKYAEESAKSNGDAGIESHYVSNGTETKRLEPWVGGGDTSADGAIGGLEEGLGSGNGTNGWGAEEMFRTNREQYGVKTSYNPDLPEYTTPLDNEGSEKYAERKARAEKLANEIEGSANYIKHVNLEVDDNITEEEKFSSVFRNAPPSRDISRQERTTPGRNRGRGSRGGPRVGHHNNYSGQGGMHRSSGPPMSGSYGSSSGRSNTPTTPNEASLNLSSQNKSFRSSAAMATNVPPRFSRGGNSGGGYYRDEERGGRYNDNSPHQHSYMSQSKGHRQGGGMPRNNYQRNHPSPTQEYNQGGEPPMHSSGQNTPQHSLSRNSSSSSVTQQATTPQWGVTKSSSTEDRTRTPASGGNPPMTHQHPAGGNKGGRVIRQPQQKPCIIPRILGRPSRTPSESVENLPEDKRENSYSSVVQNISSGKAGSITHTATAPPNFQESHLRQSTHRIGGPPQGAKYYLSPKGHSPPRGPNAAGAGGIASVIQPQGGQISPQRQMIIQPPPNLPQYISQQGVPPPMVANPSAPVPPVPRNQRSIEGENKILSKKGSELTGIPLASTNPTPPSKSKDAPDDKMKDIELLKDFSKNFKLSDKSSANESNKQNPVTSNHKATEQSLKQSISKPLHPLHMQQPPKQTHLQQPRMQGIHQSMVTTTTDMDPMLTQHGAVLMQQPPLMMTHQLIAPPIQQQNYLLAQEHHVVPTTVSPQPSINIPSPRTATTANDVVTVSAATGPFVSPQHLVQATSEVQGPTKQDQTASNSTSGEVSTKLGAEPVTEASTPTGSDTGKLLLNPDAKEFTPRAFAQKSAGITTPRSPTPVTTLPLYQPGPATYFSPTGQQIPNPNAPPGVQMQYIVSNKQTMAKQGVLSPSPNDGAVVGMSPHLQQHIHPASTFIAQGQYPTHPGPFIITQPGAPQAAAQHGVMPQQVQHYQNVEQVMYAPSHLVQAAAPRALQANYAAEQQIYGYQSANAQQVQIQQAQQHQQAQQPPQQQTSQQHASSQQSQQQQQSAPTNYVQQQQNRPHSAHTPNQAHIPPASPANNMQPQGANMQSQIHPTHPNAVIAQHQGYYPHQQIIPHAPMQSSVPGRVIQSSVPGSYPHFMMMPTGPHNAQPITHSATFPGQHSYVQTAVASTAGQVPQQYIHQQRPYHQSQI